MSDQSRLPPGHWIISNLAQLCGLGQVTKPEREQCHLWAGQAMTRDLCAQLPGSELVLEPSPFPWC